VPLYARAVESRKKQPVLDDPKAAEIVAAVDWNYRRIHQSWRLFACALRSAMFDEWIKAFVASHPAGTVIDIGAGLNTRFERLDNGRLHWFDLDLPDAVALRRKFFTDTARRVTLAASVCDPAWIAAVRAAPGPYFFVAETVLVYLDERDVRTALAQIAASFPSASVAFDTVTRWGVDGGNRDFARRHMRARFAWACEDPVEVERWGIGLRLVQSRTIVDVPEPLRSRLSPRMRTLFRFLGRYCPKLTRFYQLNLFAAEACSVSSGVTGSSSSQQTTPKR
jgi:O-methyltransferase involved in polyketide biosynthesis